MTEVDIKDSSCFDSLLIKKDVVLPLKFVMDGLVGSFRAGELERATRNGDGRVQLEKRINLVMN